MLVKTVRLPWKQGECEQVALSWGKQLEVSVDGQKKISTPWDGLFGPLAAEHDKLRLYVGHWYSGGIECEYTIDELTIMGPRPDNMACRPRASVPLLEAHRSWMESWTTRSGRRQASSPGSSGW